MQTSLFLTAALMGWAGGPHCLAMCGAPCAAMAQTSRPQVGRSLMAFQLGRLVGYSVMGALAASLMQGLGWLTVYSAALRPVWSFFHAFALVLGLWLVWRAQMPLWAQALGRATWQRLLVWVQGFTTHPLGVPLIAGMLWACLPCGLLYSALIVAALGGTLWQGAAIMATFALASGAVLGLGPWVLLRWGQRIQAPGWGMRLAGLALTFSAAAALYLGLFHNQAPWCV